MYIVYMAVIGQGERIYVSARSAASGRLASLTVYSDRLSETDVINAVKKALKGRRGVTLKQNRRRTK